MTEIIQPPPALQPPSTSQRDRVAPDCPYVGLVPFDESDAPYFFGRERDCEVLVANLTTARLTLLYASSGVGKSSVLRAGVLPRLRELARESHEDPADRRCCAAARSTSWVGHSRSFTATFIAC